MCAVVSVTAGDCVLATVLCVSAVVSATGVDCVFAAAVFVVSASVGE